MLSVHVESVTYSYPRSEPVLRDVSLTAERGERLCLWGPSGSGKSTLLALIGGAVEPSSGNISTAGFDAAGIDGSDRPPIVWVAQSPTVLPRLTAAENVLLGCIFAGLDPDVSADKVAEILERLGLSALAGKKAKRLSGGEAQRVTIGRALASNAHLILADEPTGQLDHASTRIACDALFGARTRSTVIVASHDQYVADRCDRVLAIKERSIVELV